jgi:hypothetical protein
MEIADQSSNVCHFEGKSLEIELTETQMLGCLIDIQTNNPAMFIDINDNSLLDFKGVGTWAVRQVDVEAISFRKVFDFHDLYRRSGNAL